MQEKLLKQFAITDGLIRGTALASNVFCNLAIALLSGFGLSGLLVSAGIQLIVMGLLEIPTGVFADRFGWNFSLRIALALKFIVTSIFLGAVIAAANGAWTIAWALILVEAVVDSFASSLMNGSYQAAYLAWFEQNLNQLSIIASDRKSLFLASQRYMTLIRLSIPLSILLCTLGLLVVAQEPAAVSIETLSVVSLVAVLALRILNYARVNGQLTDLQPTQPKESGGISHFSLTSMWGRISNKPVLFSYATSRYIYAASTFYFIGKSYQLIKASNELIISNDKVLWCLSTVIGVSLFTVETIFSRMFAAKINDRNISIYSLTLSLLFLLTSIGFGFSTFLKVDGVLLAALFWCLALLALILASIVQRYIASNLSRLVAPEIRATWLSTAESIGLLCFGLTAAALIVIPTDLVAPFILILTLTAILLLNLTPGIFTRKTSSTITFKEALSAVFTKALLVSTAILLALDVGSFVVSALNSQREFESNSMDLIKSSLYEPLSQGSFAEAVTRLSKLRASGKVICSSVKIWSFNFNDCDQVGVNSFTVKRQSALDVSAGVSDTPGELVLTYSRTAMWKAIIYRILITVILTVCTLFWLLQILKSLGKRLEIGLVDVLRSLREDNLGESKATASELQQIGEYVSLRQQIAEIINQRNILVNQAATIQIASQVAHDIRSPLSALSIVVSTIDDLPEEKKLLIRKATQRINDIANNLLTTAKSISTNGTFTQPSERNSSQRVMLSNLLESIVSEKRAQFSDRHQLDIRLELMNGYGLFSAVDPIALGSAISNLINNSEEAIPSAGTITISLSQNSGFNEIKVVDSGRGIPREALVGLGLRGATLGKPTGDSGHGLGLHHAKQTSEDAGGTMLIESDEGLGTAITLTLPSCSPPEWFQTSLVLMTGSRFVIVDDDPSVHEFWRSRVGKLGIETKSFSALQAYESWYISHGKLSDRIIIDYEFAGDLRNGIDMITKLNNVFETTLISSYTETESVVAQAAKIGLRMIPKSLAHLVPIEVWAPISTTPKTGPF